MKTRNRTNFNEYFYPLWVEAQKRGWNKGEFMLNCGLNRNRFAEFSRAAGLIINPNGMTERSISYNYLYKLTKGLGLTMEQLQTLSGKKFSSEQLQEMQIHTWVDAHTDLILKLIKSPQKLKVCEQICELDKD